MFDSLYYSFWGREKALVDKTTNFDHIGNSCPSIYTHIYEMRF